MHLPNNWSIKTGSSASFSFLSEEKLVGVPCSKWEKKIFVDEIWYFNARIKFFKYE